MKKAIIPITSFAALAGIAAIVAAMIRKEKTA